MIPEMKQLKSQLSKWLNWNEARIDFLSRLLIALLKITTVNLAELARAFISKAEESSRYRQEVEKLGFKVLGNPSAIVPIILGNSGKARFITKHCLTQGALVNLVEYPAVSRNSARLRVQIMSDHTIDMLNRFTNILQQAIIDADNDLAKFMM